MKPCGQQTVRFHETRLAARLLNLKSFRPLLVVKLNWIFAMIVIALLCWHKALSWKLGQSDATSGRPCSSPWWINESYYVLSYTYAKLEGRL